MVFENQKSLDADNIIYFATLIGLDVDRFKEDIQSNQLSEKVEKDFESGMRSGVNRTPTFFINGEKFEGDWSKGELLDYLKAQLAAISIDEE